MDIVNKFWSKWEAAIDKEEQVRKLSFFDSRLGDIDEETKKHIQATAINSYLEDLYEYMITKYHIEPTE